MNHDPILHLIFVALRRIIIFFILSTTQTITLWLWLWMHFESWTFMQALRYVVNMWPLSLDSFPSVMAIAAIWIGCANTAIIYLLLWRWWSHRAEVLHRRGSRFVDMREEK